MKKYMLIVMLILTSSCEFWTGDTNLGDDYYLYRDGARDIEYRPGWSTYPISINYVVNKPMDGVQFYNYNSRYVLFSFVTYYTDKAPIYDYWIIDKNIPINVENCIKDDTGCIYPILRTRMIGPLDSLSFYNKLKALNIDLKLKPSSE